MDFQKKGENSLMVLSLFRLCEDVRCAEKEMSLVRYRIVRLS